jgi:hypothetical protein
MGKALFVLVLPTSAMLARYALRDVGQMADIRSRTRSSLPPHGTAALSLGVSPERQVSRMILSSMVTIHQVVRRLRYPRLRRRVAAAGQLPA